MSKHEIQSEKIKAYLGIEDQEVPEQSRMERMASRLSEIDREMTELENTEYDELLDGLSDIMNTSGGEDYVKEIKEASDLLKEQKMLTKEMSKAVVKEALKKVKELTGEDKTDEDTDKIIEAMEAEDKAFKEFKEKTGQGKVNEGESIDETSEPEPEPVTTSTKPRVLTEETESVSKAVDEMRELSAKEEFYEYGKTAPKQTSQADYRRVETFLNGTAPSSAAELEHSGRWQEAQRISLKLVRDIRNMKAHNIEDKTTGLQKGKLNRRQLHRVDKKVFMRNDSPQKEEADLSFYLALDHSGSTCGGLDIQIGTVGLAMADALEKLHIQHHIFLYDDYVAPVTEGNSRGHNKYVLAGPTRGQGGNDEQNVMMHTIGVSEKDNHKHQILIIVTDGDGYGDATGLKEIQRQRPNMKVLVIGLNYDGGSFNKKRAESIYGTSNVMVVKSQSDFSKALTDMIKKEVLK